MDGTDATDGSLDESWISRSFEAGMGMPPLFSKLIYPTECVPEPDSIIDGARFSFILMPPAVCAWIRVSWLEARTEINKNPTNS